MTRHGNNLPDEISPYPFFFSRVDSVVGILAQKNWPINFCRRSNAHPAMDNIKGSDVGSGSRTRLSGWRGTGLSPLWDLQRYFYTENFCWPHLQSSHGVLPGDLWCVLLEGLTSGTMRTPGVGKRVNPFLIGVRMAWPWTRPAAARRPGPLVAPMAPRLRLSVKKKFSV